MSPSLRWAGVTALVAAAAGCRGDPTPTGTLLITSGFTDQVFVLDAATGAVVDSVWLDRRPGERDEPHGIAASPDGQHWYATVAHGQPTLWKFETVGHRLVGRLDLPLRGAGRVRISPDGATAAVTDYWRDGAGAVSEVALVGTHDLGVRVVAEVCPAPHDAVFSPDGRELAVTCARGHEVVVLDATTLAVRDRFAVSDDHTAHPMNASWSADGASIYASLMGRDEVVRITRADGLITRLPVGGAPAQVELAGPTLVVAERSAGTATLLDPATERGFSVGSPGPHPHGIAVSGDGRTAFVTYEGDVGTTGGVWAVDVASARLLWHTPVGVYTLGAAWLPAPPPEPDRP